jgi:outer membrane protein OmpA-like peptidoglycan-associated protein
MSRHNRITAILLVVGGLAAGTGYGQTPGNPTQTAGAPQQNQMPLFRVTVVGRTTPAINYRPRGGETRIDFAGTPLMPKAKGHATVKGEKGYIEIDGDFNDLQPATRFGPEYLTYVVWAITPEGRATNLGELQIKGDDGGLRVTTELQAFGLIVTAEPYFAVTQPSDVVVMENVVRDGTVGHIEVINAKYELLKRGSYLMNQDAGRLKARTPDPGAPLDLAEARNAVTLARFAGADRYAAETFDKADRLLIEAETARKEHRNRDAIMMPARQAAQTAEDARLIALQRMEAEDAAQQRAAVMERESAANARARVEEERRRQAENDKQASEAARVAAERAQADAERSKVEAERARTDAERAVERLGQERRASEEARAAAESARAAAEAQAQQAQSTATQAQQTAAQAEREKADLRAQLRDQLNVILETRETARGLIVNLSDVLFDTGSANLKPGAREKLAKIAGILLAHPGLNLEVEGHTDSVGTENANQLLSEQRAHAVQDYLIQQRIPPATVATAGFGENQPVASNGTAAGRQQNRRVEIIVSGEPIGRPR